MVAMPSSDRVLRIEIKADVSHVATRLGRLRHAIVFGPFYAPAGPSYMPKPWLHQLRAGVSAAYDYDFPQRIARKIVDG